MIYFLLVDRFYNGDPANDADVNLSDPHAFHGGDLRGVSEKLDYLADLGVTTLWLGPITEMRTSKYYEWGAYHGYWMENPAAVEPRFGTWADVDILQRGLHRKRIGLVLDVVLNHVAPESVLTQTQPEWFHHFGAIHDWNNPAEVVDHDVHGLPDLDQANPAVSRWLTKGALEWLDRVHPAAFRLDAVRHLPATFLASFGDEIRDHAGRGFELWGEVFDGNVERVEATKAAAKLDAVFDYPLHYALLDVVCRNSPAAAIPAAIDRTRSSNPESWITFADNHDTPRVTSSCSGDSARVDLTLDLLFLLRGRPMITWGTEWGFSGAVEPTNRVDMRWDAPAPEDRIAKLRALGAQRSADEVLRRGESRAIAIGPDWFIVERWLGHSRRWIAYNGGDARTFAGVDIPAHAVRLVSDPPLAANAPQAGVVNLTAAVPNLGVGDVVLAVGDATQLGGWDPAKAPILPTQITVDDEAYIYKLAVRRSNGTVEWEGGDNRWFLGAQPALDLVWQPSEPH